MEQSTRNAGDRHGKGLAEVLLLQLPLINPSQSADLSMAYSPISSLLRRSSSSPILRSTPRRLIPARRTSTSAAASPGDSPKSTLSARMSFVFDQIDAIEREPSEKDETLRRIRAWREKHRDGADESAAPPRGGPGAVAGECAGQQGSRACPPVAGVG